MTRTSAFAHNLDRRVHIDMIRTQSKQRISSVDDEALGMPLARLG